MGPVGTGDWDLDLGLTVLEFLSWVLAARTTLEIVVTLTWSQMTTGAVSGFSAAGKNQKNMLPLLGASTVSRPE